MNKKLIRIAGWAICLSMMAAGVGASVGSALSPKGNEISQVKAANTTVTWNGNTALPGSATSIAGDSNVTIQISSTNSYSNPMRIYANTTITIATGDNYHIVSVTYTASSNGNYVTYAQNAAVSPSATPTVSEKDVTWTYSETNVKTWTFEPSSQTRSTGISVTYAENVSFGTLKSVEVDASSTQPTSFTVGDTFSSEGLVLKLTDTSSNTKTISSGFTTDYDGIVFSNSDVGTGKTVTVSYSENEVEKTATYGITVIGAQSAEVVGDMTKKSYFAGTAYDVTGLSVRITYTDSTTEDFALTSLTKDTDYILDHDTAVLGDTTLDISGTYLGQVFDVTVTGITVTEVPITATYTISSKTDASLSEGTAPSGSSSTYSQTYATVGQATSGNSMTFTLSGFTKGIVIKGITMNMRSNSSAGAGGLTYSADSGEAQDLIASGTGFNAWGDNTSYGTGYRDVTIASNLSINVSESFTLTLSATANSLYVASYSIDYSYQASTLTVSPTEHSIYTNETAVSTVTVANFDSDPTLEYEILSGASSVSSVAIGSYSSHQASVTITPTATAGTAVVRVRDSANPTKYYSDITVVVNEIPTYTIELSATTDSGTSYGYVGDGIYVSVDESRLQGDGIIWSVESGSVESADSDNSSYMANAASAGTLTIKATDNGNAENTASVSLTIVESLNEVLQDNVTNNVSELTFTDEYSSGGASDANWTVTSDGTESSWDSTNGIHYGTNSDAVQYVQLGNSNIATGANDTIKSIVVNAQDRADSKGALMVTVGGRSFKCNGASSITLTGAPANYTFTGNGAGEIVVKIDRGSAAKKAIYVKSITVNYVTATGSSTDIANKNGLHEAQQAVIDYAEDFNSNLEAICVAYGSTDSSALTTEWNALTEQYDNWFNDGGKALTSDEIAHAKALFANASSVDRAATPSADDLQHMLAKYDWILSHYDLSDFLANDSETNRPAVSAAGSVRNQSITSESSTTLIVTAAIASAGVLVAGGSFFLRRRKEN